MNRAYAQLNIKSVNDDTRVIEGIASTPTADRQGDIVEPMGAKFTLPLPALLFHDAANPVASVEWAKPNKNGIPYRMRFPAAGLIEGVDKAWMLVKHMLVRGVSIGFKALEYEPIKDSKVGGIRYTSWEWLELSLVSIPANAEATITTIKQYDNAARAASGADVVDNEPEFVTLVSPDASGKTIPGVFGTVRVAKDSPLIPPGVSGKKEQLVKDLVNMPSPQGDAINIVRIFGKEVSPGVSGKTASVFAVAKLETKGKKMKTIQEQIPSYEASRAAKFARMTEIMTKSADEGRSLDEQETEEYDGLDREVKATDAHLTRLRAHEKAMVATAQPVRPTVPGEGASETKVPVISMGKSNLPKGTGFVRMVQALAATKGARFEAIEFATSRWNDSTPEVARVLKAAMTAGTTTDSDWAEPLVEYRTLASEFVDLLRPATIIGRMPGLRRVPFNIRVAGKTQGATVGWVGQGAPKPVSELKFNEVTLGMAKAAGIVVISQELARSSSPQAEGVIREDLVATMTQFLDEQFVNPAVAAVANVSPASITNGASHFDSTGTTIAQITADMATLFGYFVSGNLAPTSGVFIMSPTTALGLSLKRTSQDVFAFPGLTVNGGTFFGLPVIVSRSIPGSASGGTIIVLADASEIFLADDGGVRVDVSEQASIQMDSAPATGAQSLTSLWQNNLVGIRAERFVNWMRRRDAAVAYIDKVPAY